MIKFGLTNIRHIKNVPAVLDLHSLESMKSKGAIN